MSASVSLEADPQHSALLTDLYQLTMLQSYHEQGMNDTAVFEFFVRRLPPGRNFLVAAGLEQVLQHLERLRFTQDELAWLRSSGRFRDAFIDSLAELRFAGDVDAMSEGTIFFADEPVLRVTAALREAQLVETRIINLLQYQCMIAAKAARSVLAAPGKLLVDFGLRRAHGAEAGLLSARASYIAGFSGTATVLAGALWDIPLFGTMAHSFVQAHEREMDAFASFAHSHPHNCVLLIDTYDTERAAAKVVALARTLAASGVSINAVRIDSGDLAEHARRVRGVLDQGGFPKIRIFASGNLDEYRLQALVASGAPIDGFGIGTRMNTSADEPYLDCAYKLQQYAGAARRKRSEGKATWPGSKQVLRRSQADGRFGGDELTLEGRAGEGEALLQPVMRAGRRLAPPLAVQSIREHAAAQLSRLPQPLRALEAAPPYPVTVAEPVRALAQALDVKQQEMNDS